MELESIEPRNKKLKQRYKVNPETMIRQLREEKFNNRVCITDRPKRYQALTDPHTSYYFSNRSVKDHLKKYKRAIRQYSNEGQKKKISKLLTLRITENFKDHLNPKTIVYQNELTTLERQALSKQSTATIHKRSIKKLHSDKSEDNFTLHKLRNKKYLLKDQHMNNTTPYQLTASLLLEYPPIEGHQQNQAESQQPAKKEKAPFATPRIASSRHNKAEQLPHTENFPSEDKSQASAGRLRTHEKEFQSHKQMANRLADDLHKKKHEKWLKFLEQKKQMLAKLKEMPSDDSDKPL